MQAIPVGSTIYTDERGAYRGLKNQSYKREKIDHGAGEYVRDDVSTNGIESVWAAMKRGLHGVYHHASEKHLHRYAAEFAFRYSNRIANGPDDRVRADLALMSVTGKRLKYQRPYQ